LDIQDSLSEFYKKGYAIVPIEKTKKLVESRNFLAEFFRNNYGCKGSVDEILNNCHKYIKEISDEKINSIIMSIINEFKKKYKMDELVYESSKQFINNLLGKDIASQKNPNIVFQYPFSTRTSELHADAPANSFYEVVSWVPLVDCYSSKSFYILDKDNSRKLRDKHLSLDYSSWPELREEAINNAIHLKIKYGYALFFWSGLLHGSVVNTTDESRWSYNVRFKNLFAPAGMKEPLAFYRVLSKSALTEFAVKEKF
jgi:sporadic carbohydrate cluster 2OG-Fe(II) oxygenase